MMVLADKPMITIDLNQPPEDQVESVMDQLEELAETLPRLVFLRLLFDVPDHVTDVDMNHLISRADALFPAASTAGNDYDRSQWVNWLAAKMTGLRTN
jgi:hypothetical protein